MKEIPLGQGLVTLVDDDDYEWLAKFKWHVLRHGQQKYAYRRLEKTGYMRMMHRDILGLTDPSIQCDHRDHNGLHNWRGNLRQATNSQNMQNRRIQVNNTTGFMGVRLQDGKWRAQIKIAGEYKYLGCFESAEAAARRRDEEALKHRGEFAVLNFPLEGAE